MDGRLLKGLRYVAGHFSATRDDFRKAHGGPAAGAEMLLDGLASQGLVNRAGDRMAVSDAGLRALAAQEQ